MPEPGFAGAVLTGGRSRRMGADKALLAVGGTPMAARLVAVLEASGASPVLTIGGDEAGLRAAGLTWCADRYPGQGPLGGLLTAFEVLGGHDLVAVVATDMPDLDSRTLRALAAGLAEHDVALADAGRLEPLCGIWRTTPCRAVLQAAFDRGERAVHRAVRALDVVAVAVDPASVRNVNLPEDLRR